MASSPLMRLYIDTNIYLDHLLRRSRRSSRLLKEIGRGKFLGITSHFTFSELAGVLKEAGLPPSKINTILNQLQAFPNIQIVFHEPWMFAEMPNQILNTCAQSRDALHYVIALYLKADKIVTRDHGFKNAVSSVIPCVTPEELLR